jgi:hypothetical protein
MPDTGGRYRSSERSSYQSPPCSECGGRTIQRWIDASSVADTEDWWVPGTYACAEPQRH